MHALPREACDDRRKLRCSLVPAFEGSRSGAASPGTGWAVGSRRVRVEKIVCLDQFPHSRLPYRLA